MSQWIHKRLWMQPVINNRSNQLGLQGHDRATAGRTQSKFPANVQCRRASDNQWRSERNSTWREDHSLPSHPNCMNAHTESLPSTEGIILHVYYHYMYHKLFNVHHPVMWSETVGFRTRPVSDQKNWSHFCRSGVVLWKYGLAMLVIIMILKVHSNFSSTIYSFAILCLEHHYCGDQQWRLLT